MAGAASGVGWGLVFLLALVGFCWLRLAGTRPGGRPPFLLHGKKGGKETCPAASVPESFALRIFRGNLRPQALAEGK